MAEEKPPDKASGQVSGRQPATVRPEGSLSLLHPAERTLPAQAIPDIGTILDMVYRTSHEAAPAAGGAPRPAARPMEAEAFPEQPGDASQIEAEPLETPRSWNRRRPRPALEPEPSGPLHITLRAVTLWVAGIAVLLWVLVLIFKL